MDYFSQNYYSILKAAFNSYCGQTLLISLPAITALLISVFFLVLLIGTIVLLINEKPSRHALGSAILILLCMILSPMFLCFSYLALPETLLKFNNEYKDEVYAIYKAYDIKKYKSDDSYALNRLQYGASGNIFKTSQQYLDFQKALLSKVEINKVVYQKDLEKDFNKEFLTCLGKTRLELPSEANVEKIKDVIEQENNVCLNYSIESILSSYQVL